MRWSIGWLAVLVPALAVGQTCTMYVPGATYGTGVNDPQPSDSAACSEAASGSTTDRFGTSTSYSSSGGMGSCQATITSSQVPPCSGPCVSSSQVAIGISTVQVSGPQCKSKNPCQDKAGQEAFVGGGSPAGANTCSGGCEVATSQPAMTIHAGSPSGGGYVFDSTYTGNACQSGEANTQPGQCTATGGVTACAQSPGSTGGKNCGTFNGDQVCVQSIPPGTCQSFASGGVACTASASGVSSPPDPNNGTAGTPAAPTGSVAAPVGSGGATVTTNYYSSSVVSGSSAGVVSNPGGGNVGNGGAAGSTGGGSGPSAANGDCGASGVNCGGDGTTPQLPTEPTMQQAAQTYYGALASVPVVAAVGGIAAAVPDGECPTATFSVFGRDYTLDVQCQLWAQIQGVLSAVMLVFWTLIGVRVLMSA